jgi:hypothetical protein
MCELKLRLGPWANSGPARNSNAGVKRITIGIPQYLQNILATC